MYQNTSLVISNPSLDNKNFDPDQEIKNYSKYDYLL